MAICKILYMKESGKTYPGKHLQAAINYISDMEKTQQGRWISAINCQPNFAYEQMLDTKTYFGKIDKRQGYHLIISFQEGEVDANTAFEITEKFTKEYLGGRYEAIYAVHDNTEHIHSHIVFNSVSFVDGRKYRYKKGDWAKFIQPITNRLCSEYGISTIEIEEESREDDRYEDKEQISKVSHIWSDMIKKDVDACILQAQDFDEFLILLQECGYEIKQNKYLAIKAPGMKRYSRVKSLGSEYTKEQIKKRIPKEWLAQKRTPTLEETEQVVFSKIPYGKRAELSPMQKRYYAKLYRIGLLKQRPYSKAWKYREEIKQMARLQEQYLFLVEHEINSVEDLNAKLEALLSTRKEMYDKTREMKRDKDRWKNALQIQKQMEAYWPCEEAYQEGDMFFLKEHQIWEGLESKLKKRQISYEKCCSMREYFQKEGRRLYLEKMELSKSLAIGKAILKEVEEELIRDQIEEKDKQLERKQPSR